MAGTGQIIIIYATYRVVMSGVTRPILVSGTQTSFFFFVGAGKNEGLGHMLY